MDGKYHDGYLLTIGLSFCLDHLQGKSAVAAVTDATVNTTFLDQLFGTYLCAQILRGEQHVIAQIGKHRI